MANPRVRSRRLSRWSFLPAFLLAILAVASGAFAAPPKIEVCHRPQSPSRQILALVAAAVPPHLTHGDHVVAIETCDGLDNDCDGATDEGFLIGAACGTGECAGGVTECRANGSTQCATQPGGSNDRSSDEVCDSLDNDCDGTNDDGFELGAACGEGACAGGVTECSDDGAGTQCASEPGGSNDQSTDEVCDGVDNDCDGTTDDGESSDGDVVADDCDNCPDAANAGQEDGDPVCGAGSAEGFGSTEDLGNACDNCDLVCNDQLDTHGIRAASIPFIAAQAGDCVDSSNGFSGETDDLQLADDELSHLIDLDDEDGNGVIEGDEAGDFAFQFFGKTIDRIVISANGYVYLLGEGENPWGAEPGGSVGTDPKPNAGVLPLYEGTDFIVAAAWTDLKSSTLTATGDDPCISFQNIGDNTSTNQVMEITFERAFQKNDTDNDSPLSTQIRLFEADDRIEIHTTEQTGNLEASETDQLATRGVEGLFSFDSVPSVGAAFLAGDNFAVMVRVNDAVVYTTSLTPENDPAVESGDACDNVTIVPRCGDGACNVGGGETLVSCPSDCFCGDAICDAAEGADFNNVCGLCAEDCGNNCCGNAICEGAESESCPVDCS